jgi:hypothetical protein
VPANASLVMKSYSSRATRRLPTVTRSVIVSSLACHRAPPGAPPSIQLTRG